jgi:Matrixin
MAHPRGRRLRARAAGALLAVTAVVAPALPASTAEAATATYRLHTQRLPDGRTVTMRWNGCQAITYKVNLASVPAKSRAAVLAETHTGLKRLAAVTGFRFVYRGATAEVPRFSNTRKLSADIVIAYTTPRGTDMPLAGRTAGYGGFASSWWGVPTEAGDYSYGAANVRGYLVIDTPDAMKMGAGFGKGVRRGNLLLHELGHVVGLDHVTDARQLMYPNLHSTTPNGYAAGDLAGLARIGRKAGCIGIPASVVADLT